jgi:hypothetical protein
MHGLATVLLVVWGSIGMIVGGVVTSLGGWFIVLGLATLAGWLAVLVGAVASHRDAALGGRWIIVGATLGGGCLGALAALWGTTDWKTVLSSSIGGVVFFGGIPVAIGAEMRRRGGASRVGLRLRLPRLRRRRTSRSSP